MDQPTPEQITKLPKWAQEFIRDIQRERETAIDALNKYCDSQTVSPVSIQEWECTGERQGPSSKTRYVQTHRIEVNWQGVQLDLILRDDHIDLQWSSEAREMGDVAMIPEMYQGVILKSKDYMR